MVLKSLSVILLTVSYIFVAGQDYGIFKKYATSGMDAAYGAIEVEDGFIIGGYTNTDINPKYWLDDPCMYLVKVDSLGNKIWERTYRDSNERAVIGYESDQKNYRRNSLIRSIDGNIICIGGTNKFRGLGGPDVLKVNLKGDLIWEYEHIPDTSIIEDVFAIDGIEDKNGNILILCTTSPFNSRLYRTQNRLIKIDKQGKLVWQKNISIKYRLFNRFVYNSVKDEYVLFGNIYFHDSYDPHKVISDTASALIVSKDGEIIKDKILFSDTNPDNNMGDYVFFQTKNIGNTIVAGFSNTDRTRRFLYLDENLEKIELKVFDNSDYSSTSLTENYIGFKYYSTESLVFTDNQYNTISKLFYPDPNISFFVTVQEKCQFHSGSFSIGYIENKDENNRLIDPNGSDIFFIKTNDAGYSSGSSNHPNLLKVYPNPPTGHAYISFNINESSPYSIKLFDYTGKLIQVIASDLYENISSSYIKIVDVSYLNSGIYFITLETNNGITSEKMLIR